MGRHAEAEPLHRRALEICEAALGPDHPDVATSLNNLAVLLVATNRVVDARRLMERAAAIDDRMIGQVFSIGSESQRAAFLKETEGNRDAFLSLVWQHFAHSAEAIQAALDLVLRRKAIGAEALAAQRDAVLGGKYPAPGAPTAAMVHPAPGRSPRRRLAGPGPEGPEAHQQLLAEWHARKERLEADLARQIPEMNLEQRLRAADRRAVALALPEGVALVEFVRFDVFDFQAVPARGESPLEAGPLPGVRPARRASRTTCG